MANPKNDTGASAQKKEDSGPPTGYRKYELHVSDPEDESSSLLAGHFYAPKGADMEALWGDYISALNTCEGFNIRMFQSFADWLLEEQGFRIIRADKASQVDVNTLLPS